MTENALLPILVIGFILAIWSLMMWRASLAQRGNGIIAERWRKAALFLGFSTGILGVFGSKIPQILATLKAYAHILLGGG